jgi:hypothetical protein
MRIVIRTNILSPRLAYTIDFINRHPLKPSGVTIALGSKGDMVLYYGQLIKGEYHIPSLGLFFKRDHIDHKTLIANTFTHNEKGLLGIGIGHAEGPVFDNVAFRFDLFETIFFLISRYEEVFAKPEDNYKSGWLKESQHFLIKNGWEQVPVVDHLVKAFYEVVTGRVHQRNTTYSISHDIDILYRFKPWTKALRNIPAIIIHRRGAKHLVKTIAHLSRQATGSSKDPYNVYDWLFQTSDRWTSKTLYMLAGGTTYYDDRYQVTDPDAKNIVDTAISRGYELGLHPSYDAGKDQAMMATQKEKLARVMGQRVSKSRQHCLRWFWDTTPDQLTALGMQQDSSMGYNRHLGFRCGTGFAYQMYDFKQERAYPWLELPMAFMESSMIHQATRTGQPITNLFQAFIKSNQSDTHIEMNWHNSNFDQTMAHGAEMTEIYANLQKVGKL